MHGYQANAELVRREIRDWAGLSRPQVYYSLEKLARGDFIRPADTGELAAGPERVTYATTAKGRTALTAALAREDWATQRERPAFLTWLALSWQASPETVRQQLHRRAEFLQKEIVREKETLASVLQEVGHRYHEAVWMLELMIEKFETELRWVRRVTEQIRHRGKAKHPDYAKG
jgi:DNA-binding PadR family transcriptional regulator